MKRLNRLLHHNLNLHKKLRIQQYIMLLITAVTLTVTIVLFLLIRSYTNKILTEQHLQRYLSYAHQYFEINISDMVENIYMELTPLHVNSNLTLSSPDDWDAEDPSSALRDGVYKIVENSELISCIRLLNNNGTAQDFCKEDCRIASAIDTSFIQSLGAYDIALAPEVAKDIHGNTFIVFGQEWMNYNTSFKSGKLLVFVDCDKILNLYQDSILTDSSIYITLDDMIMSSSDPSSIGKQMFLANEVLTEDVSLKAQSTEVGKYFLNTYSLQTSPPLHLKMTTFISKNYLYQTMRDYNIRLFILFWVAILFSLLTTYILSYRYSHSIRDFTEKIQYQELSVLSFSDATNNEISMLEKRFSAFVKEIDSLIMQNREALRQKQEAEFTALQAQINPHFLYNTLESISGMAKVRKQPEIQKVCVALGRFFRLSLQKGAHMVLVEQEINHVKSYITIEQIRFPDKFDVIFDIDETLHSYYMPKIILQPIVENAIHHAFNKIRRKGTIRIIGREENGYILFRIEDDGVGLQGINPLVQKDTPGISGYGLYNVNKRIQLEYGTECGLFFEETPNGGTTVIVKLKTSLNQI